MSSEISVGEALLLRDIFIQQRARNVGRAQQASASRQPARNTGVTSSKRPASAVSAATPQGAGVAFARVLAEAGKSQEGMARGRLIQQRTGGQRSQFLRPTGTVAPSPALTYPLVWDTGNRMLDGIPYADLIGSTARRYGVSPSLIAAVVKAESGFNPMAQSRAGAKGLMQLMDDTARSLGVSSVFDPAQNIEGGVRFLASLLTRFGGDPNLALAAYNAGAAAVERYGGIPPYRETRDYVSKVLSYWREFERSPDYF